VNREAGKAVTGVGIKERIKEIIEAENPRSPVSDQEIAGRLASLQMEISRRTVAKYRDQLGIPSASVRKAGLCPITKKQKYRRRV
jgi:RNA polymerase sigma-54 factor